MYVCICCYLLDMVTVRFETFCARYSPITIDLDATNYRIQSDDNDNDGGDDHLQTLVLTKPVSCLLFSSPQGK